MPIAELVMAWEMRHKRTVVETEGAAQRAVFHLPLQLAVVVHQTAQKEYEQKEARCERKTGEMGTCFKAVKFGAVAHLAARGDAGVESGRSQILSVSRFAPNGRSHILSVFRFAQKWAFPDPLRSPFCSTRRSAEGPGGDRQRGCRPQRRWSQSG